MFDRAVTNVGRTCDRYKERLEVEAPFHRLQKPADAVQCFCKEPHADKTSAENDIE